MFAQFRYLDGPAKGEVRVAGQDFATLGRDPAADIRFDPTADLEVSVRHAAVFKQGGGFLIRDLGSTNGTFLNGRRVRGDCPIEAGDRIRLGPSGPEIEFATTTTPPHVARAAAAPPEPRPSGPEIHRPKPRPTARVGAIEPPRSSRRWWWWAALVLITAGVLGTVGYRARAAAKSLGSRRAAIEARLDDLRNRLAGASAPNDGLRAALAEVRSSVDPLAGALEAAADSTALANSAGRLDLLERTAAPLLTAAAADPAPARLAVAGRVGVVMGEFARGVLRTATGFVVRSAGDTAWLATSRQVAVDSAGSPAGRYAVLLEGSHTVNLARLVRVDDSTGVALVAMVRHQPPAGIEPAPLVGAGQPVIAVGFPPGADSVDRWKTTGVASRAAVATVIAVSPSAATIERYGGAGWPGSILLTPAGKVVGMAIGPTEAIPIDRVLRIAAPR